MKITENCTGCGACYFSCPKSCIKMKRNWRKEAVPVIDKKQCINCGKCKNVCPSNVPVKSNYPMDCFACFSKDEVVRKYSASGGASAVFMREALNKGYSVYGCDYDNNLDLNFFEVKSQDDILRAQSSKYSRADVYKIFSDVKEKLESNKPVLFIALPCQIAGLKRAMGKEYENLVTVDIVCHGTPPNDYLKAHVKKLKLKVKPAKIRFRGEYDQKLTLWDKDGKIIYQKDRTLDSYFWAFYQNVISYHTCYTCKFARPERVSDITIGDFWGLKELKTIEKVSNRPSLVLINTDKGKAFFEAVNNSFIYEARPVTEGISGNGRLNNPPGVSKYAKLREKTYRFLGFEKSAKLTLKIKDIRNRK